MIDPETADFGPPTSDAFLAAARELALQAGRRLMELRGTDLTRERKPDQSLVTNADHAANDILRRGLREAFPGHGILSEETGVEGPPSPHVWLVDPLDGTKAYAKGVPGFSVMVGLLREGRPVLGVVYDPLEGRLYEAARGQGSFCSVGGKRERVRVSDRNAWDAMPLVTSTGFPEPLRADLATAFPFPFAPPVNSVGIKVGLLVRREADVYVNHHPVHYWDTCAPLVILEEAGGVMTFWDGAPLTYDLNSDFRHAGPTLASNNRRHGELSGFLSCRLP